ncbi:hypothetical protein J1N35_010959 [Gossypium stocksii]|uniref:Uncharacterized protein n=1 Tax=Gossypium stocksii TaxID=47602 RepID=A0A9D4AD81_9ROSI|nr:hypothetical protein J1N35_010959 [Gossypium stocksii]
MTGKHIHRKISPLPYLSYLWYLHLSHKSLETRNTQAILPNTHELNSPLTLVTIHNSIKFTSTNYLLQTQIKSIIIGYDLHKFTNGSHPSLLATATISNAISPNPAY